MYKERRRAGDLLPKFIVVPICPSTHKGKKDATTGPNICNILFVLLLFWSLVCFVASDVLTTICHLVHVNVCVIIILSIGNTQISILLLYFMYLLVELMITMNK